jgi:hypothetical protein
LLLLYSGFPYIPFHLDVFRAIRKVVESPRLSGRSFGFRIHCGESVPFPLGDLGEASVRASTTDDLEAARKLHIDIEEMCFTEMFRRTFRNGGWNVL